MRLDDDMRRVVNEQSLGFVATVCPDGTPNLSPKGTTIVWDDERGTDIGRVRAVVLVHVDVAAPLVSPAYDTV